MFIKAEDYNGNKAWANIDNISLIQHYNSDKYKVVLIGVDVPVYVYADDLYQIGIGQNENI